MIYLTLLCLILAFGTGFFAFRCLKYRRVLKRRVPMFDLFYSFDPVSKRLLFCTISPVLVCSPRNEFSNLTCHVFFNDLASAEAERARILDPNRKVG